MATKRREKRTTHRATGSDGRRYSVEQWVTIIDCGNFEDPGAEIDGMASLQTSDGMKLNRLDKGKYQTIGGGLTLTSDDPNAP